MRLAPGAWTWSAPFFLLAVLVGVLGPLLGALALALAGLGVLAFHRDPERAIGDGFVAPSDGVVAQASEGPAGPFLGVFLNLHDVHVIRAPEAGTVLEVRRIAGPRLPAWHKRAPHNAGVELRLSTAHGEVRVRMLTGLLARRVVAYVKQGQVLAKGERIGLIRFGSRVEVVFPPRVALAVQEGTRLTSGETTVARPQAGARTPTH